MALFTDGGISTIDDLLAYESSILEVARTEGIDLAVKLELAQDELGIELTRFLVQEAGSGTGLENVVVTEPLQKWHTFQALGLVYRDAYNSQLNDRHLAKWKEWGQRAKWASTMLFDSGVGVVDDPVPKAELPELGSSAGPLAAATYYVRAAWLNGEGEEGCPSELAILTAADGHRLTAQAVNPPAVVRTWNLYAGFSHADTTLQTEAPLGPGAIWVESDSGLRQGRKAGSGQAPDYYILRGGQTRDQDEPEVPGLLLRG
ncbi:MAG: hypothetical protein AAB225_17390 [Acidobacteriota bacterium]